VDTTRKGLEVKKKEKVIVHTKGGGFEQNIKVGSFSPKREQNDTNKGNEYTKGFKRSSGKRKRLAIAHKKRDEESRG